MRDQLLQGRYRLLDPIGRGGMGEVWCARDEALERRVAVKCLKPVGNRGDTVTERALRARFRREARTAASLQHRGVTVVHDFGEWDGVLYLVMELLDGSNLRQVLRTRGSRGLPLTELLDIAEQLTDALAYTHGQGVVHRDLKPANIVRTSDGAVKICDFGIARLARDVGFTTRIGGTRAAMGTPHYMSPEQIAAGDVDHRSDLYSLGCVLYELATGRPPFDHEDAWSVLLGHRDVPPRPPRTRRVDLPDDLERLVLHLLAKRAGDRPRDAHEVARRLRALRVPPSSGGVPRPGTSGPGAPVPRLPGWARGMAAGLRARGRPLPAAAAFGPVAELNEPWSGPARQVWALGRHHPRTLAARQRAAGTLARFGRVSEALAESQEVCALRERLLGPDHPDTLASRQEIAVALGRLGRWTEALEQCRGITRARIRTLGPGHPQVRADRQNEIYCEAQLRRQAAAGLDPHGAAPERC